MRYKNFFHKRILNLEYLENMHSNMEFVESTLKFEILTKCGCQKICKSEKNAII